MSSLCCPLIKYDVNAVERPKRVARRTRMSERNAGTIRRVPSNDANHRESTRRSIKRRASGKADERNVKKIALADDANLECATNAVPKEVAVPRRERCASEVNVVVAIKNIALADDASLECATNADQGITLDDDATRMSELCDAMARVTLDDEMESTTPDDASRGTVLQADASLPVTLSRDDDRGGGVAAECKCVRCPWWFADVAAMALHCERLHGLTAVDVAREHAARAEDNGTAQRDCAAKKKRRLPETEAAPFACVSCFKRFARVDTLRMHAKVCRVFESQSHYLQAPE